MQYKYKILIGCPIRNRDWILSEYLKRLIKLNYPKHLLAFHFILNDSTDNSKNILYNWKSVHFCEYRYIRISEVNFGYPTDLGEKGLGRFANGVNRSEYGIPALAVLRNMMLDFARLDKVDYLFSIDSDILVNPDILNNLINTKKDIVAGLIHNSKDTYNFLHTDENKQKNWKRNYIPEKIFEVKLTGAVVLISKKVFNNIKIRYYRYGAGEDHGFCNSARKEGIRSYVLADLQTHVYDRRYIRDY